MIRRQTNDDPQAYHLYYTHQSSCQLLRHPPQTRQAWTPHRMVTGQANSSVYTLALIHGGVAVQRRSWAQSDSWYLSHFHGTAHESAGCESHIPSLHQTLHHSNPKYMFITQYNPKTTCMRKEHYYFHPHNLTKCQ